MFANAPAPMIEIGSIGWEDEDEYFFKGDESNDGHTLVRVQLFRGKDPTKPVNPKRAQGLKMIAHLNSLAGFRIPAKDTRCYVAVPAGMEMTPGAAVILALVEKSPTEQFEKDRVVIDYGDTHVLFRAKSISLQDRDDNFVSVGEARSGGDPAITMMVGSTGMTIKDDTVATWTSSAGVAKVLVRMTTSKYEVLHQVNPAQTNIFKMDSSGFTLLSPGTGYIMPATLMMGCPPTPPPVSDPLGYAPLGTVGKLADSIFFALKKGP